jgi:CDP-paratose 2-epimerase
MERVKITDVNGRYEYGDYPHGIDETYPLDFHSPYGCSKGCADQYMIDYARIYGLQTVTLRQSCIYGYRQFGIEDQGWVAWFVIAAALQKPITIYGDGKQVRDVLFIEDLVRAYECAYQCRETTAGNAYNIGGGAKNTLSLLELIALIQEHRGEQIDVAFAEWRPGDQKVFVADIRKAARDLGWTPQVSVKNGIAKLIAWVDHNREVFEL